MNYNFTTFQHYAKVNTMLVIAGIIRPAKDDFFMTVKN